MKLGHTAKYLSSDDFICFTSDLDWAPEASVSDLLDAFRKNNIKPTIFVTHQSEQIALRHKMIDVGIHPNLILPSSQGNNQEEILEYCCSLVNKSQVFRCHRWFASNDVYKYLWNKGYRYESNICTDGDLVMPFVHRSGMVSFPVFFEDGAHIEHARNLQYAKHRREFHQRGLKVINIHPMHYSLNTPYFEYTRSIKDRLTRDEWHGMNKETLKELSFKGEGIRTFIDELMEDFVSGKARIVTLSDIYAICYEEINHESS